MVAGMAGGVECWAAPGTEATEEVSGMIIPWSPEVPLEAELPGELGSLEVVEGCSQVGTVDGTYEG